MAKQLFFSEFSEFDENMDQVDLSQIVEHPTVSRNFKPTTASSIILP